MKLPILMLAGLCVAVALPASAQLPDRRNAVANRVLGYYVATPAARERCIELFPELKEEVNAAVDDYLQRNRPVANKLVSDVRERMLQGATTDAERADAVKAWEASMDQIDSRVRRDLTKILSEDPEGYCDALPRLLDSGKADLAAKFPEELRFLGVPAR